MFLSLTRCGTSYFEQAGSVAGGLSDEADGLGKASFFIPAFRVLIAESAGENHWHGAPDATSMAHITITVKGSQTEQTEA